MNGIPLCELNALRQIEAHFDGAYVSLLTKLGQYYPEQEQTLEQGKSSEVAVLNEQGDATEQSSDDDSNDNEYFEDNNKETAEDSTNSIATCIKAELVTLALAFAKLLNKNLLAAERVTQLESQVSVLQREICTLRAIATKSHELCLYQDDGKRVETKRRKPKVSNMIAFKTAVEQEIEAFMEAQNNSMQLMERKYKNQIFGLTLAVDYLKKEVAGRVQQMQIYEAIYGTTKKTDEKNIAELSRIWTQLVYEIALNRHKTIVRLADAACRGQVEEDLASGESGSMDSELDSLCTLLTAGCSTTGPQFVNYSKLGQVHFVSMYLEKSKPIGVWISGGAQCHMPLIIQKVETGSVAAASSQLSPGDIILSIQNFDMIGTTQVYCAQLLKSMSGWCRIGIVRIPVPDLENVFANRKDFNFELLYDNFPSENEHSSQSMDATEDEGESTETGSEGEESETFTNGECSAESE